MADKAILVLCAQVLLIQSTFAQCIGPNAVDSPFGMPAHGWGYDGLAYDGLAAPLASAWPVLPCGNPFMEITPTAGGLLPVTSSSAIPPTGISVISENAFEGILAVAGEVPFVGTTAMEGALPTGGAGAINYGCGNGVTAMVREIAPTIAPGIAAPGIASGLAPNACGAYSSGLMY